MESLSSSDMPGSEEMLMVNDPSLNLGKKLLPKQKNTPTATTNNAAVATITLRVLPNTQSNACS